jgi:hypothetical protein
VCLKSPCPTAANHGAQPLATPPRRLQPSRNQEPTARKPLLASACPP